MVDDGARGRKRPGGFSRPASNLVKHDHEAADDGDDRLARRAVNHRKPYRPLPSMSPPPHGFAGLGPGEYALRNCLPLT